MPGGKIAEDADSLADSLPAPGNAHMAAFAAGTLLLWIHLYHNDGASWLIHPIDLAFHEAGHLLTMAFGKFVSALGGTLFQCLIPLLCIAYFFRRREPMGMAAAGLWLGENFIDVGRYVADARARQLDLVSLGPVAEHDWTYLLGTLGLLRWDTTLGACLVAGGCLIMLAAAGWYAWLWARSSETVKSMRERFKKKPPKFRRRR